MKIFSHDVDGGFFPSKDETRSYNADDPDANLYSILDQIEKFRKDGVFHVRMCYEEFVQFTFPCNEWTQSSNFAEERIVTDYKPIEITFTGPDSDPFLGLRLSDANHALITGLNNWWFGIGGQFAYTWGLYCCWPVSAQAQKVEVFLAIGRI